MKSPESAQREIEPQPATTHVYLEFMRHGKKEKPPAGTPDTEVRITEESRAEASSRGAILEPRPDMAVAFGSPRKRSQETSARFMLGGEDRITQDMSLEDIESVIAEELSDPKGINQKKIAVDERLNFLATPGTVLGELDNQAYAAGRYMDYLVRESDGKARQNADLENTTYSRRARGVAQIVQKYSQVGDSFQRIVNKDDEHQRRYAESGNQLERYLGTHQSISECFVSKVLEKTGGLNQRDEFLQEVGSGFKELEGIHIEITNSDKQQTIVLRFTTRRDGDDEPPHDWEISLTPEILDEVIADGNKLDDEIRAQVST